MTANLGDANEGSLRVARFWLKAGTAGDNSRGFGLAVIHAMRVFSESGLILAQGWLCG